MGSAPEAHQPLAENPTLSVIFFALQKIVLNVQPILVIHVEIDG
jgi:hypothetical protein